MNKLVESLHMKIASAKLGKEILYETMLAHSDQYKEVLGLSPDDIEQLQDIQKRSGMYPSTEDKAKGAFLTFKVKGEEVALYVETVCGCPYGGDWSLEILATCTSNPNLNEEIGYGTTLIGVIPKDYHKAVLEKIKESPN